MQREGAVHMDQRGALAEALQSIERHYFAPDGDQNLDLADLARTWVARGR